MPDLPTTYIEDMFENPRFEIERVDVPSLAAMENDLRLRLAKGERWQIAIVEASEVYIHGASNSADHGMMLLRKKSDSSVHEGLHYPKADCGAHNGAVRSTAVMLCLLLGDPQVDEFYEGFLRYYPKVMAWDLETDQPQIEPID